MSHHLSIGWVSELKTRVMVLLQELQEWYLIVDKKWTAGLSGKVVLEHIACSSILHLGPFMQSKYMVGGRQMSVVSSWNSNSTHWLKFGCITFSGSLEWG